MPNVKEYNNRLKSLKNTQKITRTMKMVSASKLKKAQEAQANAKFYARKITELLSRISASVESEYHPLLLKREPSKRALILVYTSDKGLCGAFNHNAHKQVINWLEENRHLYEKVDISCCGRKGYQFFQRREAIKFHYEDVTVSPNFHNAEKIGNDLMNAFLNFEYDEVFLVYNQFLSPLSQKTIFEKVLPIEPEALVLEDKTLSKEYIFEPEAPQMLEYLIPHFLYFKVYFALLENSAGEHGARMSAMDSATKNTSELIDQYTILRNRARQAVITTELTEIVAGAEALH